MLQGFDRRDIQEVSKTMYTDFNFMATPQAGVKQSADSNESLCLLLAPPSMVFGQICGYVLVLREVAGGFTPKRYERIGFSEAKIEHFGNEDKVTVDIVSVIGRVGEEAIDG